MTGMGRLKIRDGNLGNFLQLMDPTFWSPRTPIGRSSVLPDNACHLSEFVKRAFGPGFPESCWCCCYGKREYTLEGVNVAARRALSSLVCTHRMGASFVQTQLLFSSEREGRAVGREASSSIWLTRKNRKRHPNIHIVLCRKDQAALIQSSFSSGEKEFYTMKGKHIPQPENPSFRAMIRWKH